MLERQINPQPGLSRVGGASCDVAPVSCERAQTAAYCGPFLFETPAPRSAKAFPAHCSRRPGDLPVGRIMLGFWHRRDVFGGIAQRQELAPPGTTMGSTNRLNQTTSHGIIVSDVKRQQSEERKQQH